MKYTIGKNVKFIDKKTAYIDSTVKIGNNVVIYENNRIEGNTTIGDNCIILPGNHIKDSTLCEGVSIESSNINGATIGEGTSVGPFSRIRPTTIVGKKCKVGNFVELKNSILGDGTKASHLTYVGDAEIGTNCNLGCGVIFVNYDGVNKNKTKVGNNCFIGSNANLIAPLTIADDCFICAGTTVTKNVEKDDFVIGRARQEVKPGLAKKYLVKKV